MTDERIPDIGHAHADEIAAKVAEFEKQLTQLSKGKEPLSIGLAAGLTINMYKEIEAVLRMLASGKYELKRRDDARS